jgi:hypothetical protein
MNPVKIAVVEEADRRQRAQTSRLDVGKATRMRWTNGEALGVRI